MQEEGNRSLPLEELVKKLLDVEGYVIFAGSLSNKTDEHGNRILDFDYYRHHLVHEDMKKTIENSIKIYKDETTLKGIETDEG